MIERLLIHWPNCPTMGALIRGSILVRHRFLALLCAGALTVLGVATWISISRIQAQIRRETRTALSTVLKTTEQAAATWQKKERTAVEYWAQDPVVRQLALALTSSPTSVGDGQTAATALAERLEPARKNYLGYFLVGPHDIILASSHPEDLGRVTQLVEQPQVLARLWGGDSAIGLPTHADVPLLAPNGDLELGLPNMFVGAPVLDHRQQPLALLVFRINPADDFTAILQRGRLGASGESYAFDDQGRLLSETRFEEQVWAAGLVPRGKRAILNLRVTDPGGRGPGNPESAGAPRPLTRMARSATSGLRGEDLEGYRDYRGVEVLGAWAWDPTLGLGITTEIDEAEAYGPGRSIITTVAASSLLAALLIVALAVAAGASSHKLATSERRLADILEHATAVVVANDVQGRYILANPRYSQLVRHSPAEFLGRTPDALFEPELAREFMAKHRAVLEHETAIDREESYPSPEGEATFLSTRFPLHDADGQTYAVCTVGVNITRRCQAERSLKQLNDELEQRVLARTSEAEAANLAKTEFLARMSHEIRTPLNAIIGMTYLTLRSDLSDLQRDHVEKVHRAGHLLLEIVNEILDFSKIEAGRLDIEQVEFDLDELFDSLIPLGHSGGPDKRVELIFDVRPQVPRRVVGDPGRLRQVLVNLVGNAMKFTAEGEVVLTVEVVSLDEQAVMLAFTVRDSGIGIDPERIPSLFEPFTQADGSTGRRFGGTGLGLAITKRLVELMGGKIDAASRPEGGSIFTATCVLAPSNDVIPFPNRTSLAGLRLLVVDRNPTVLQVVGDLVHQLGMEVTTASTGADALEHLRVTQLTGTPRIDGIVVGSTGHPSSSDGLFDQLYAAAHPPTGAALPVLLMATPGELAGLHYRNVPDAFLQKPVTRHALLDAVSRAVGSAPVPTQPLIDSPSVAAAGRRLANTHLLVVDDNEINLEIAQALLATVGARVTTVSSGPDAVAWLATHSVDAVLMDVQMPGQDGYQTTRIIRQDPRHTDLPIISMTADVMPGDRQRAADSGMNDHVGKPVEPGELYRVLARWVSEATPTEDEVVLVEVADGSKAASELATPAAGPTAPVPQPSPRPAKPAPILDTESAIARLGDVELYRWVLASFRSKHGDWFELLQAAVTSRDWATAAFRLHSMKGLAGTIGATQLQEATIRGERSTRASHAPDLEEIERIMTRLWKAIDRELGSKRAPRPAAGDQR